MSATFLQSLVNQRLHFILMGLPFNEGTHAIHS
jgi:hypothetical protein